MLNTGIGHSASAGYSLLLFLGIFDINKNVSCKNFAQACRGVLSGKMFSPDGE